MKIDEKVVPLKASLFDNLPFCSGVLPVTPNDLGLYYCQGENARHVNLNRPPAGVLEQLMNACEPAQFGRGDENVFDESYRKAGQLKADVFRPMLDVRSVGLIHLINEVLLGNSEANRTIYAELYNLNVYGQGSFFKAHVDTPRGKNMFGSLVVFYPTAHEGGAIVLRKNGQEWTYDSSQVFGSDGKTQLGYVALYSDVEHEVLPVTSGYRVSITYNLYFDDSDSVSPPAPLSSSLRENAFKTELKKLLDDPDFLPKGGRLGFGLEYTYPARTSAGRDISGLGKYLKGVDANVLQYVNDLGLESSFWGVIKEKDWGLLACKGEVPKVSGLEFGGNTYELDEYLYQEYNARVLFAKYDASPIFPVTWVKVPGHWGHQMIITYGNEHSIGYTYHAVCLIVEVGVPGDRGTPVDEEEPAKKKRRN